MVEKWNSRSEAERAQREAKLSLAEEGWANAKNKLKGWEEEERRRVIGGREGKNDTVSRWLERTGWQR
jgi:hypothetical protein